MSKVCSSDHQKGLILFAHGARDPEWVLPLQAIQKQIGHLKPGATVELAFLEFMAPDLATQVHQMHKAGIQELTVVPIFMAQGGHLKKELPVLIASLKKELPSLTLRVSEAVGTSERVIHAMARQALADLEA